MLKIYRIVIGFLLSIVTVLLIALITTIRIHADSQSRISRIEAITDAATQAGRVVEIDLSSRETSLLPLASSIADPLALIPSIRGGKLGTLSIPSGGPTAITALPLGWRPDLTPFGISNEKRDAEWESQIWIGDKMQRFQYFGRYEPGAGPVQTMIINGEQVTLDFSYVIRTCSVDGGEIINKFPIMTVDGYYYPTSFLASGHFYFINHAGLITPLEDHPWGNTIYAASDRVEKTFNETVVHSCEKDESTIIWPRQ